MSATDAFLKGAKSSLTSTATELTSMLREYLMSSGWPFEAAMSVLLSYSGETLSYDFEGPAAEAAQTLEFGNESQRPTAAVRKFLNKSEIIEKVYLRNLEDELGDIL